MWLIGLKAIRYADDVNVYVRSQRVGQRVMALLKRLYEKLHLSVNETRVRSRANLAASFWDTLSGHLHKVSKEQ